MGFPLQYIRIHHKIVCAEPAPCPYEYEVDKDGKTLESYPDRDNHAIDAVRYALSPLIADKKEV